MTRYEHSTRSDFVTLRLFDKCSVMPNKSIQVQRTFAGTKQQFWPYAADSYGYKLKS